ncbi:predicted protein [Nematostella vectensis]|uniref:Uncharacterized protein n=1 Tax=Nematostella vectensis TaxID=45351 RepID=A7T2A8_NEMVE|nr:predicted protein [Nematostella vectensis]|eukprot:XP_001622008.1 predicted protein [Nematostella vectensis]
MQSGESVLENLDDDNEKQALQDKISELEAGFESAKDKAAERQGKLEKVEPEAQQFRQEADIIRALIEDAEKQVHAFEPLSSDLAQIAKQRDLLEQIKASADKLVSGMTELGQTADSLKDKAEADEDVIQDEVDDLLRKIKELTATLNKREAELSVVEQAAEEYHVTVAHVEDVFTSAYDAVDAPAVFGTDTDHAEEQLHKIKALRDHLNEKQGDVDKLGLSGDTLLQHKATRDTTEEKSKALIGVTEADKDVVESEACDAVERYDKLNAKCALEEQQTSDVKEAFAKYADGLEPLRALLDKAEPVLGSLEPVSGDVNKNKEELENVKKLKEELEGAKDKLNSLNDAERVLEDALTSVSGDPSTVQEELAAVTQKYHDLLNIANAREEELEKAVSQGGKLRDMLHKVEVWIEVTEEIVEVWEPVKTDPDVARKQLDAAKLFMKMIADRKPTVESVQETGREILKTADDDKRPEIEIGLADINSQWVDLNELADARQKQLEDALAAAQKFDNLYKDASQKIADTEERLKVEELDAAKAQPDEIKAQLDKLQELCKEIDAIEPVMQASLSAGNELIPHCDEDDRDIVNMKMDKLKDKYRALARASRDKHAKLTEAANLSDRFFTEQDNLLNWFDDMKGKLEDARAEDQEAEDEQKKLKDLQQEISNKQPSIKFHMQTVDALKKLLAEDEKPKVASASEEVHEKWKALSADVENLAKSMFSAQERVEAFNLRLEEMKVWLKETEEKLEAFEPVGVEPENVKKQLSDHTDDRDIVNMKMDKLKDKYRALARASRDKHAKLTEAANLSDRFFTEQDNLLNWFDDMKGKLEDARAEDQEAEDEQKKLKDLQQEISNKQPSIKFHMQTVDALKKLLAEDEKTKVDSASEEVHEKWKALSADVESLAKSMFSAQERVEAFNLRLEEMKVWLKETEEKLEAFEPVGVEPENVKKQLSDHTELRKELDGHTPRVTSLCEASPALVENCSPGDRAHVQSELNAVTEQWEGIEKGWQKRRGELVEVKVTSEQYHKLFEVILVWLDELELKLSEVPPVGTELATVQEQLKLHKAFHAELTPHQSEITQINQLGSTVGERCRHEDSELVHAQLEEVNHRWDELCNHSTGRQQKLEEALLQLGQFQLAFQELLVWLRQTDSTLDEQLAKKVQGDVKYIEIELAKHKILQNDILSHEPSVDSLSRAASALLESGETDSTALEGKVQELKTTWDAVLAKSAQRQAELEKALKDSHSFMSQIKELRGWLNEASEFLKSRRAIGGRPENATKQLNKHKELKEDIDAHRDPYKGMRLLAHKISDVCIKEDGVYIEGIMSGLEERWKELLTTSSARKRSLDENYRMSSKFFGGVEDLMKMLDAAEEALKNEEPIGVDPAHLRTQLKKHKEFQTMLGANQAGLDATVKMGKQLMDRSLDEDAITIEGKIADLKARWDAVCGLSVERLVSLRGVVMIMGSIQG